MATVVLVIHLLIALTMIGVILMQRSEGGGLGIGGGGMGGMMTARSSANLLTRTTAILAGCFMVTSITLAVMAGTESRQHSIIETMPVDGPAPAPNAAVPAVPTPVAPTPATPTPVAPTSEPVAPAASTPPAPVEAPVPTPPAAKPVQAPVAKPAPPPAKPAAPQAPVAQ